VHGASGTGSVVQLQRLSPPAASAASMAAMTRSVIEPVVLRPCQKKRSVSAIADATNSGHQPVPASTLDLRRPDQHEQQQ
jgi:hypothetical protein